jgi:hypothetical protein
LVAFIPGCTGSAEESSLAVPPNQLWLLRKQPPVVHERAAAVMRCTECARLEYILHEQLGQELTGIALMLEATRRAAPSDPSLDATLARISHLLANGIDRCRFTPRRS